MRHENDAHLERLMGLNGYITNYSENTIADAHNITQ